MTNLLKPIRIALQGKGPVTTLNRITSISRRYGFSPAKMGQTLQQLIALLAQFSCKATFPITSVALARNPGAIAKYQTKDIEFAVHGYRHIDYSRLIFSEQKDHMQRARQIFSEAGILFSGFRCPYLRWNQDTMAALGETGFTYDSSNSLFWEINRQHLSPAYERALEFYGAQPAAAFPALPFIESNGLVRIPYSLPDDEALVERLKWSSAGEMAGMWAEIFGQSHQQGQLFTLGLHPERTANCKNALTTALQAVQSAGDGVWRARLDEIAAWWQARRLARIEIKEGPGWLEINVDDLPGISVLLRGVQAVTKTEPWFDGYERAVKLPCLIKSTLRPFIGVSPQTPPAFTDFLIQQGYVVETTTNPALYSFYFDRLSFDRSDEGNLLAEIEATKMPLLRLARWPHAARSAFTVTGDIDALTLGDYVRRLRGQ